MTSMLARKTKIQIATGITALFHLIGLVGILVFKSDFIIRSTPINLILAFALLIWTQIEKNFAFFLFLIITSFAGLAVETIGVQTGWLFGNYRYSDILGVRLGKVPVIIGINWTLIVYCCGVSVNSLFQRITRKVADSNLKVSPVLKTLSILSDGATLAVIFDWLMEPVAIKLGYWKWDTQIPLYNYISWFLVSILLLIPFQFLSFNKQNKFAVNLLLIQLMFFMILRTFLIN